MAIQIGTGVTFTKGSISGNVTNIAASGASRPSIPTGHLDSTVTMPFIPGQLTDWGSITMDFNFDADTDGTTWLAEAQTTATDLVISFNDAGSTTFTVAAFTTDHDPFTVPLEDLVTASMTWKMAGIPAWGP
ncbi:hypothetical protein LCGC14_3102240 [marine sediment metagenome]|uniref:Uncharacterized protein n=1 Tax=marine sediment metagenome TaxID=412755 RepID=A0A0F8W7T1_9ZZZZ